MTSSIEAMPIDSAAELMTSINTQALKYQIAKVLITAATATITARLLSWAMVYRKPEYKRAA